MSLHEGGGLELIRGLVFATMYLFRYLSTDTQATEADKELARIHISAAHQIFMRYTFSKGKTRAVQIIELLGNRSETDVQFSASRDTSHFAASIWYDAVREAEQIRSRLLETSKSTERGETALISTNVPTDSRAAITAPMFPSVPSDSLIQMTPLNVDGEWSFPLALWDYSWHEETLDNRNGVTELSSGQDWQY